MTDGSLSQIPFTVTRQEVNSFLGRGNQSIGDSDGPHIHIIMERSTGKTMDCFVEYFSEADAEKACARLNRNYDLGSAPRMGNRHVDVEMSSPAKLMKALFPLAKCVQWVDGSPVEQENKDHWSTGFDGFLTDEELFCLVRHAEQPHRVSLLLSLTSTVAKFLQSAFASKIPQRCYESFISTLWKVRISSLTVHHLSIFALLTSFVLLHSFHGTQPTCTPCTNVTSSSILSLP